MPVTWCQRVIEDSSKALDLLHPRNIDKWMMKYFHLQMGKWHYNKWQEMANDTIPSIFFEAPMGHAKTTYFGIYYPIWKICRNRKWTSILGGASLDIPMDCVRVIEQHLETNEQLIADYGAFKPKLGEAKWQEKFFYVKGANLTGAPTLRVTAVHQTIAGKRAWELLFDDIVDNKNSDSPILRKKTTWWFNLMFMSRKLPGGLTRGWGTEYGMFTLYQDILTKNLGQYMDWKTDVLVAEHPNNPGPNGELWPEVWPLEKLQKAKADMGSIAYAVAFMNDPRAATGHIFKEEWLRKCLYSGPPPSDLIIGQGVDLAASLSEHAAYFVIMTIGVHVPTETIYILDIYRAKIEFPEQVTAIRAFAASKQPVAIGIEDVAYQTVMPQHLTSISALPIKRIKTGTTSKFRRLLGLTPLFEQGKIKVPADAYDFQSEYLSYDPDAAASPDQLDALDIAIKATFPEIHQEYLGSVLADDRKPVWEMR